MNLAENTDEFKHLILNNENYLKATWNLTELFKNQIENFKKILSLLRILVELNQDARFSSRLLKHIKSTIRELEKYFGSSNEQLDEICDLYKIFASRRAVNYSRDNSGDDSGNEEEKEKLRRVYEFISSSPEKSVDNDNSVNERHADNNNNSIFENDLHDLSPHSSDDEVYEIFFQDLKNILLNQRYQHPKSESKYTIKNEWEENK
jgi:hypothetical protein